MELSLFLVDFSSMNHYVYRITDPETGEFYYGSRSCEVDPKDDEYMGSYVTWIPQDIDRLEKEILKSDFSNREEAISCEASLIKEFVNNELNRNYHIPSEGFHSSGKIQSVDERRMRSEKAASYWKGKRFSEEHRNKIKESNKKFHEQREYPHWNITRDYSEQEIDRKSKNNARYWKGRKKSNEHIRKIHESRNKVIGTSVEQYTADGDYVTCYRSYSEAAREIGCSVDGIIEAVKGRCNTMQGFQWKDKNDSTPIKSVLVGSERPVRQLTMDGEFIRDYPSVKAAADAFDIPKSYISAVTHGRQKSTQGFRWQKLYD